MPFLLTIRSRNYGLKKLRRRKRWLLGAVAIGISTGALATAGYSLARSKLNSQHLTRIDNALSNELKKDKFFVQEINLNSKTINALETKLETSYTALSTLATAVADTYDFDQMELILMEIGSLYDELHFSVDEICDGLHDLKEHHLSPYLTDEVSLGKAFADARTLAAQKSLTLSSKYKVPSDLFQAHAEVRSLKNTAAIVIKVETSSTDLKLNLYRFMPFPLHTQGLQLNIHTDQKYLVVDSLQKAATTFGETEFAECTAQGQEFICPHMSNVFRTKDDSSVCLLNIFKGRLEQVKKTCLYTVTKDDHEIVRQIEPTKFAIYTPNDSNLLIECSGHLNNTNVHLDGGVVQTVDLPVGCRGVSSENLFYPSSTIMMEENFIARRPITFNASALLGLLDHNILSQHLHKLISDLKASKPLSPIDTHEFTSAVHALDQQLYRKLYHHRVELGLGAVLFVLVSILLTCCMGRMCLLRYLKRKRKSQQPISKNLPYRMFMARNYYHRAMTDQEAEQSASTPIMKGPAKQQGQSDFSIALNGRRQKKDAPNPPPGYTMTTTQATAPLTAPQDFFGILSA